jgi:transglutaminase-like putative cysteine protease
MRFKVRHITRYLYDRPVFLDPQTIRLRPRGDAAQRLLDFSISLEPSPAGLVQCLDPEGNDVACVWFNGLTETLAISTSFEVETLRVNPFDFILTEPGLESLPAVYPDELRERLTQCLDFSGSPEAAAFAGAVATETGCRTLDFLNLLCSRIHETVEMSVRLQGAPLPPGHTLAERRGSCRDLAVLFIAACRSQGLATRFVSGYQEGDPDAPERHLHAWAEVYLPGGGWRGFDPTHGLAVSDRHVAVAASMTPQGAAPVSGRFRGSGAISSLDFELHIRTTPS